MIRIIITEHTTSDAWCEVENLATGEVGEWYDDADSFIAEVAGPNGFIVEEIRYS